MHMLANPTAVKLEAGQLARLARMTVRGAAGALLIQADPKKALLATRVRAASCHDGAPLLQTAMDGDGRQVTVLATNTVAAVSVGVQGVLTRANKYEVERFFRRHTEAEATDASVAVYRLDPSAVYVESDNGTVRWIDNGAYLLARSNDGDLEEAEAGIVEHVNGGHPDTIHAILSHRGVGADDWVMTGADPEGIDVAREAYTQRIAFDKPVHSRDEFKKTMIALRVAGGGVAVPPRAAAAE